MGLFRTTRIRKRFGEILIEKGLATKEDIEDALRIQGRLGQARQIQKKIGVILHEKGVIGLEDIENTLDEQRKMESFLLKGMIYSIFHSK